MAIYDQRFEKTYLKALALKELNEKEIKCARRDASGFRNCENFADPKHDYSFDLDIFEPNSIFQYINRTSSIEGEEHLRDMLLNIEHDPEEIQKNTQAVKELAGLTETRQSATILGLKKPISLNEITKYAKSGTNFKIPTPFIYFCYLCVAVTIITIILYLAKIIPSFVPLFMFIFQLILSVAYRTKINSVYGNLNNAAANIAGYSDMAQIMAKEEFKSSKLKEIASNLEKMAKEIKILRKILNDFDSRNNGLIYIVLNGLVLKDIFSARKTTKWFKKNAGIIPSWPQYTSEFEALCSLGNFAFNNPDFIFPEISEDKILESKDLCHPLIEKEKRVGNDITVGGKGDFFLITGANMAGKSTFIRSIGINLVLASCGAPVCAKEFKFRPIPIFTSMRTSDKLLESSSYFQAELTRLQMMKEKIESNELTLVLLDEILKGTNSTDKLKGSRLILMNLVKMNAAGLISTHDIALHTLEDEMPEHFHNYSFEFEVSPTGELIFDYKLHKGVSQNMNAGILLKRIFH